MDNQKQVLETANPAMEQPAWAVRRVLPILLDAILFVAVLGFSAIAIIALAISAPFILGVTAIAGAFSRSQAKYQRKGRSGWRVAQAS